MPDVEASSRERSRSRSFAFAMVALLVATLFSILLAELVVRTFWPHRVRTPFALDDPRFLYRNEPGLVGYHTAPGEFAYHFTVNSRGFRGGDVAAKPDPGTLRVLCVGDSFTWGTGVEDEETYPARLAEILAEDLPGESVEVVNAGVMSWGVSQYYRWTLEEGLALDPDVIVIAMFHDDWKQALLGLVTEDSDGSLQVEDLAFDQLRTQRSLLGSIPGFRWMMTNSQLLNWVRDSMRSQVTWPPETHAYTKEEGRVSNALSEEERERKRGEREQEALALSGKMLTALVRESSAREIPVVLAWIPDRKTILALVEEREARHPANDAAQLRLTEILEPEGVGVVDPRAAILAELKTEQMGVFELYFRRDGHFYPRGYEILAESVAPAVLAAVGRSSSP